MNEQPVPPPTIRDPQRDLLLCPFCGAPAILEKHKVAPVLAPLWHVRCGGDHCYVAPRTGDENRPEDATTAWNTRAPLNGAGEQSSDAASDAATRRPTLKDTRTASLEAWRAGEENKGRRADDGPHPDEPVIAGQPAWQTMLAALHDAEAFLGALKSDSPRSRVARTVRAAIDLAEGSFKPCVFVEPDTRVTVMQLVDALIVWEPWGPFKGHAVDLGYDPDGNLVGIQIWDDVAMRKPLSERVAREAWRPIETAPKDGTEILAYSRHHDEWSVVWWHANTWSSIRLEGFPGGGMKFDHLTHWQPLSAPSTGTSSDAVTRRPPSSPIPDTGEKR